MNRIIFYCLLICFSVIHAKVGFSQKNLVPASQSALTGMALPEGTKEDKRMLVRAAAKSLMDMEAKDQGAELGNRYEVFLLPSNRQSNVSSFIVTEAEANGWKLGLSKSVNQWGWMQKGEQEMMIHIEKDDTETYLYLAEVLNRAKKVDSLTDVSKKPDEMPAAKPVPVLPVVANPEQPENKDDKNAFKGYHFSVTNFDDGWVATAKYDWIELVKGNITVLIHFANQNIKMGEGQTPVLNANAWDVLVAPRYVSKADYYAFNGTISYMRSSATTAMLTDKQGKTSYVVMFRRGGGPFMEFICPDKTTFIREFGVDISPENEGNLVWSSDDLWLKMDNMQYRNKFAVAPADLPGYWTESSFAGVQMYYASSGNYAGMNATSTAAEFWIESNGTYRSQHKGATGMVGNQQFFQQEYKGQYIMNGNWEISLTNRFNGKTDTFLCSFEVVRGGRILHLTDKFANGIRYQLGRKG